jgi:hypothetical protein
MFGEILLGVVRDFADHAVLADVEVDVAGISYRDVERFEDEGRALVVLTCVEYEKLLSEATSNGGLRGTSTPPAIPRTDVPVRSANRLACAARDCDAYLSSRTTTHLLMQDTSWADTLSTRTHLHPAQLRPANPAQA